MNRATLWKLLDNYVKHARKKYKTWNVSEKKTSEPYKFISSDWCQPRGWIPSGRKGRGGGGKGQPADIAARMDRNK